MFYTLYGGTGSVYQGDTLCLKVFKVLCENKWLSKIKEEKNVINKSLLLSTQPDSVKA